MDSPLRWLCRFLLTLPLLLAGCGLVPTPAPIVLPTSAAPPPITRTATRPPMATTSGFPTVVVIPSTTPDAALVSELYTDPTGILTFRYPVGWTLNDLSGGGEVFITARGPANDYSFFGVNLLNVDGPLAFNDLQLLANDYLSNAFNSDVASLAPTFREEGDQYIATVVRTTNEQLIQFEIRFTSRPPYYQVLTLATQQSRWDVIAPTLDAMARSVTLNVADTALPTPTPSNGRLTEGLALEHAAMYTASTGSLYIVGEVINNGPQPYEAVQGDVEVLDAAGATVARQTWSIERKVLRAGERSPFLAIFSPAPAGTSDFRITLSALPAATLAERTTSQFETRGVVGTETTFAAYSLNGQVANLGPGARAIVLTGIIYDEAGQVLGVGTANLEIESLQSNQQTDFTLTFFTKADGDVARHEIWVDGLTTQ